MDSCELQPIHVRFVARIEAFLAYIVCCTCVCSVLIVQIETSNLHRQVLYRETQAGKSKAKSAAEAIRAINSNVR